MSLIDVITGRLPDFVIELNKKKRKPRSDKLPEGEVRKRWREKKRERYNSDPEYRALLRSQWTTFRANMTEEQRERRRQAAKNRRSNMTDAEYEKDLKRIAANNRRSRKNTKKRLEKEAETSPYCLDILAMADKEEITHLRVIEALGLSRKLVSALIAVLTKQHFLARYEYRDEKRKIIRRVIVLGEAGKNVKKRHKLQQQCRPAEGQGSV